MLREYDKVARECARDGVDHPRYLLRLLELELLDRERRLVERRIRQARFPATKGLDSFVFTAIPSLNRMLVLELARCEYILRRENIIALGNSGTGKTHVALGLGLAACQRGFSVAFTTAAGLVHQLMEARDEKRLLRLQRELQAVKLLIIDELGYVPLSPTGAELMFEVFSQRYERGSTIVTSNLPFEEWTAVLVKGFVDAVVILCYDAQIARHARSFGHGEFVYDPLHYLTLLETKPRELDQAAALQGWDLPPAFQHLRHLP